MSFTTTLFNLLSKGEKSQYKTDAILALHTLINSNRKAIEKQLGKPLIGTVLVVSHRFIIISSIAELG
jgi:hypothetical protein